MSPKKTHLKQIIRTPSAKKTTAKGAITRANHKEKQSGIAIVTVLSVLMLMSVLMLAFFSAASTELESSRHYASSLRTRQLTDIVTNMVIAQVRKATTPETRGVRTTWSSQPGLITTFTNRGNTYEQLVASKFKLYSSAKMEARKTDNLSGDFDASWQDKPAQWVDLNAPSYSKRENRLKFPIVDPRAYVRDQGNDSIEGFRYVTDTSNGSRVEGVVSPQSGAGDKQRLPMPVQWLYMLDDGTLGYLDDANKFIASSGSGRPSKNNPISARLAFWTDDESTKVNINTASEGVHWDTPWYDSDYEQKLSTHQPAKREFNRYPGSPSMVSLSSVFFPHQVLDTGKIKSILELAPKIAWGGSEAGTKSSSPESGVPIDEHRLYPTVDELLYRHSDSETNAKGESPRKNNLVFENAGARELLERSRFFLTANSNGPELTMHGTPRFSMWPLHADVGADTFSSYDHLIEYCTNIGGAKYYFRRRTASNRHGETYRILAAHNGNMLYNYLDIHSTQTIPGYGRSIAQKYGAGDNSDGFQILTQCWDYSRCSNLSDPSVNRKYGDGRGQVASSCLCGGPPSGQGGTNEHRFRWDKVNTFPAKGLGRLYTASEITLVFIGATPSDETTGGTAIEIGVLVEVFCPNHGFSKIFPNGSIQLNGPPAGTDRNSPSQPGPFRVNGKEIELIRNVSKSDALQGGAEKGARPWGAHGGPRMFNTVIQFQTKQAGTENADIKIPIAGETIEISVEGPMRVITYDDKNDNNNWNLIQMAVLEWPKSFTIPKPSISADSWKDRVEKIASGAMDRDQLIRPGDVTRSMVVAHGDYRHITAKRLSEPELFQPHFEFKEGVSQVKHAHSLTDADGFKFHGFSVERDMIPGANYAEEYVPDFPISPANASFAPLAKNKGYSMDPAVNGDWDTGVSIHLDGPYSGRPDDGSAEGNNPYFDKTAIGTNNNSTSKAYFSPNRLISGPGMLGSLPTGVRSNVPWRTLLFRPNTEHFGAPNNPATGDIPDHLFMDLFWMPVVEPYAISMPFATRGKINLNYQIIPFDNIKRATALHALMKAERVLAIPTGAGATYKTDNGGKDEWRHEIDAYETLKQAEDRFDDNRIFRSPSEICELYLVPKNESIGSRSGVDYPSMRTFWEDHKLTGDNVKERPYANMYPRLTTKSNVFKVHMIVQTLKKVRSSKVGVFDPDKDKVSGQWSGSAIIERFIDPNDERIPDYRGDHNFRQPSLENFYNYRVLHVKQFTS